MNIIFEVFPNRSDIMWLTCENISKMGPQQHVIFSKKSSMLGQPAGPVSTMEK